MPDTLVYVHSPPVLMYGLATIQQINPIFSSPNKFTFKNINMPANVITQNSLTSETVFSNFSVRLDLVEASDHRQVVTNASASISKVSFVANLNKGKFKNVNNISNVLGDLVVELSKTPVFKTVKAVLTLTCKYKNVGVKTPVTGAFVIAEFNASVFVGLAPITFNNITNVPEV